MHYCKSLWYCFLVSPPYLPSQRSSSIIIPIRVNVSPQFQTMSTIIGSNHHFILLYITKRKYNLYPLQTSFNAKIDFHPDLKWFPRFFAKDPKTAKPEFSVKLMVITSCPSFLIPLLAPRASNQPIREGHLAFRPIRSQETGNDPIEPRALPASGKLRWK